MGWKQYAAGLLLFNALGALAVYVLQRAQLWLPLNPQNFPALSPDSSFNTAVSFVTNTNWQGYSGESTMSYLTQMAGLAVQNFLSAATGIVVAIALIRGLARHGAQTIGNFWVDLTRATLYVLLPLALVLALALVSQGVIQNFSPYKDVTTLEALTYQQPKTDAAGNALKDAAGNPVQETLTTHTQTLPMGPIASQESIKELGTNGGGFLNANSAHPYENPTPLSNLLEMLAILIIPAALTYTFGRMVGRYPPGLGGARRHGDPVRRAAARDRVQRAAGQPPHRRARRRSGRQRGAAGRQHGRQGSALRHRRLGAVRDGHHRRPPAARSTRMHDSFTPLGGFVPLFNMQLGEVVFGGVGTGPVFDADLRHRRSVHRRAHDRAHARVPGQEDRGVRDEDELDRDPGDAVHRARSAPRSRSASRPARARVANPGAHGFSEILYAFYLRRQQQRQCLRRHFRQHAVLQHGARHSPCGSGASGRSWRCSRSPVRSPRRSASR